MKSPLLVLDVHFLCHRAFHTMRELSYKGQSTGVIFGFLKSVVAFKEEFNTDRVAFCFEHSHLFRRDIYPDYKRKRRTKQWTPQQEAEYSSLSSQIARLRKRYLPMIGFKNIFCVRGFESDDLMAEIAQRSMGEVLLVTSDSDLYQCLNSKVSIYSPQNQKLITEEWLEAKYGVNPVEWAVVKVLAGCHTDEVKGVPGVGESTALKYVLGTLPKKNKAYQRIESPEGRRIIVRNHRLVRLPFQGCPELEIQEDKIDTDGWRQVCEELGMRSLAGRPPIATRKGWKR